MGGPSHALRVRAGHGKRHASAMLRRPVRLSEPNRTKRPALRARRLRPAAKTLPATPCRPRQNIDPDTRRRHADRPSVNTVARVTRRDGASA